MKLLLKKNLLLFTLLIFGIITFVINQYPVFIEQYYSTGLYPIISQTFRFLLGWLPFSVGDIVYAVAIIWAVFRLVNFLKRWRRKQLNKQMLFYYGRRVLQTILFIYISFNWLWGFNYNRLGSAYQMNLTFSRYSNEQLIRLTDTLTARLNAIIQQPGSKDLIGDAKQLATLSAAAYTNAEKTLPFLQYRTTSVKPEMLYKVGSYLGFLGYLNPFTHEAQINTTIPKVLLPYVCCHEMAHQLGYASESEANFIGYLACKQSPNTAFRYSVYLDLFAYSVGDLYFKDTAAAKTKLEVLPQRIKEDRRMIKQFFTQYKNPLNPVINWVYDKYLKANSQPKGSESYNEVIGWLVAYAEKYGWDRI